MQLLAKMHLLNMAKHTAGKVMHVRNQYSITNHYGWILVIETEENVAWPGCKTNQVKLSSKAEISSFNSTSKPQNSLNNKWNFRKWQEMLRDSCTFLLLPFPIPEQLKPVSVTDFRILHLSVTVILSYDCGQNIALSHEQQLIQSLKFTIIYNQLPADKQSRHFALAGIKQNKCPMSYSWAALLYRDKLSGDVSEYMERSYNADGWIKEGSEQKGKLLTNWLLTWYTLQKLGFRAAGPGVWQSQWRQRDCAKDSECSSKCYWSDAGAISLWHTHKQAQTHTQIKMESLVLVCVAVCIFVYDSQ